ncbi:MAG: dienelactone hydrolase family protein [Bacteroidia bacterium]|nr:dienelactone hydrolase family protein [Bacteroidia bacterium]
MHRHTKNVTAAGKPLNEAKKAMIMVHGRGASPDSILSLREHLALEDFALLAPAATANTWYPYSFMAPTVQNEPGLSTGLGVIKQIVEDVLSAGIEKKDIYFLGFSQGACLTSEFLARNADTYGGAFIYSGGVIGDKIDKSNYQGNFGGTPILLGCSDVDAHVPLERVQASTKIFEEMGATVTERIYPNAPHTIFDDEIELTNQILKA